MIRIQHAALALVLVAGAAFLAIPASAQGLAKGSTLLSFQFAHGNGDFATPESGTGGITAYDHSEWGGQLLLQHLVSENWALAVSAGIGTFKETDEPGTNAAPGTDDFVYTQSSFNGRLGFDRFVHISPEFHLYAGPGLQFWSGKAEFDDGTTVVESENTTRVALSGRIGVHTSLSESVGLNGYMGGYLGRASATDTGAKASWMPSGHDGAVGISFSF
jgi:hypothetical protein